LNLDAQRFAFLNLSDTNSILSSSMLLSNSHSAVARLNAEQTARLVQELAHTVDVIARLTDEMESATEVIRMPGVEMIAKTAIGSGVVVWVMHVSQVVAALLAASSAWMHIDPLSILNASKEALPSKSSDIAEALFDNQSGKK
jgi:transposase